jgi:ABC-type transport system substrate-binding protein
VQSNYWSTVLSRRLSRRRAIAATGSAAAAALFLAACGGDDEGGESVGLITKPEDTTKSAKKGGTLKLVQHADVPWLDPGMASQPASVLHPYVYSQMLRLEPGHMKSSEARPVPDIMESWEFSPDGLTMTMKLRQGVKWHNKAPVNGRALDIDDIVFSWRRMAEKGSIRPFIVNAVNPGAPVLSFTATDRNTITVKLKEPTSYITAIFAYQSTCIPLLPKETDSTFDARTDQIGTGPFVLEKYTPSQGFVYVKNPDYYDKTFPNVDRVEIPILTEYAARLAQFKAGNVHAATIFTRVNGEDIAVTKKDVPALDVYEEGFSGGAAVKTAFNWLPEAKSPWLDERVRQAYSMSIDRDAFIDAAFNVSRFEAEGLPVNTAWNTVVIPANAPYWLDPKDSSFGPNAKYFQHDVAGAKQLLSAAGHASGIQFVSAFPEQGYPPTFIQQHDIISGMIKEAGFQAQYRPINVLTEFNNGYRDASGQVDAVTYKIGAGFAQDAVARIVYELDPRGGINFFGFSASGRNDKSGDPVINSLIDKAKAELDEKKRVAITHDIVREMGKKQWMTVWPGTASGFYMAWPAVKNFQVWREDREGCRAPASYWWLDQSKAPFA